MFCKSCGNQIDNDSSFCSYCGVKQSDINKFPSDNSFTTENSKTFRFRNLKEALNPNYQNQTQPKYDLTYEKENGATVFGIILLIISFILVIVAPFKFENENSYDQFTVFISISSLVLRIIIVVFVINISKRQNRKPLGWAVLAFFLPSIALIIMGQLKKLFIPHEKPINSLGNEQHENIFDYENIEIPRIISIKNDKVIFADGIKVEVIKDKEGKYFIVSNTSRHYYKTQDTATRAAYIYKVTNRVSKIDIDN